MATAASQGVLGESGPTSRGEGWSLIALGAALDALVAFVLLAAGCTPVVAELFGFLAGSICWLKFLNRGATCQAGTAAAVVLLGTLYFIRTGVVASSLHLFRCPAWLAVSAAIAVTALSIRALRPVQRQLALTPAAVATRPVALFLVAGAVVLRLVWAGTFDLMPHEAYYFQYAQHLSPGYLDHPPMVAWLIALGTRIFGRNEFGVRILSMVPWLATVGFTYLLAERLYNRTAALAACGILVCLPYYFFGGILVSPDSALMAGWAAALYYAYRALRGEGGRFWLYFGVAVGAGMLSKYSIALVAMTVGLLLVVHPPYRRFLRSPYLYGGACLGLLVFSPVIYWNATHDWASFAFQTSHRVAARPQFSLHFSVVNILCLVTPLGAYAIAKEFLDWRRAPAVTQDESESRRFALYFTLGPLSAFVLFSLFREPKLNWTGPCFLAALPLLGAQVADWRPGRRGRLFDGCMRTWTPLLMGVLVVAGLVFHYAGLGIPGIPYPDRMTRFLGWKSLGEGVRSMARESSGTNMPMTVIVGMDRHIISSELAFYVPDGVSSGEEFHFTGRHVFGKESLMWRTWGEDNLTGARVIMVGARPRELTWDGVDSFFDSLSPVRSFQAYTQGKKSSVYVYREGRGFRPQARKLAPDDTPGEQDAAFP